MPVSIGAYGGLQPMANVQYLKQREALDSLIQIRDHLRLPGRNSGTLVLVGRSKADQAMQLVRKGSFRTFFTSSGRLDDTRDALRELMTKAGLAGTRQDLEEFLRSPQTTMSNRVPAAKLLELLEAAQLDSQKPAPVQPDHAGARRDSANFQHDLPDNPSDSASVQHLFADNPQLEAGAPPHVAPSQADSANAQSVSAHQPPANGAVTIDEATRDAAAALLETQLKSLKSRDDAGRLRPILPQIAEGKLFKDTAAGLAQKMGLQADAGRSASGSFGEAIKVTVPGETTPRIFKAFKSQTKAGHIEPRPLTLSRTKPSNEANPRYLTSAKDPDWTRGQPVAPAQYTVVSFKRPEGQDEVKIVSDLELRALLKEATFFDANGRPQLDDRGRPVMMFKVYGLGQLMPLAQGEEVFTMARNQPFTANENKALLRSALTGLKSLAYKGIIHRDIKSENLFFDRATGKATFIDPSMMFKQSRNRPELQYCPGFSGTFGMMHPRMLRKEKISFEADLYALGVTSLETLYPKAVPLVNRMMRADYDAGGYSRADLESSSYRDYVDRAISIGLLSGDILKEFTTMQRDLDTEGTPAHFAAKMLELANKPAKSWVNRYQAQRYYDQLLSDPYLASA
jgi:hypothetical protein